MTSMEIRGTPFVYIPQVSFQSLHIRQTSAEHKTVLIRKHLDLNVFLQLGGNDLDHIIDSPVPHLEQPDTK